MKNKAKLLMSLILFASLVVVSCGKNPSSSSKQSSEQSTQPSTSEVSESSSDIEQSDTASYSSQEDSSSAIELEASCKDGLHNYVKCVPVDGGHRKACTLCGEFVGEKENHVYFNDNFLYCPTCGAYSNEMERLILTNDFDVTVKTENGNVTRKIISNIYKGLNNEHFTLSSPSNAHGSYTDSSVAGAKFYYDNVVDDGTKLFVLKETAAQETIGTCKKVYTYTLSVYNGITSGTFSYTGSHISINEQAISSWLEGHTPLNQITYKYLYMQHHGDDYRVPVPGTCAIINEVTCEDCQQFLYQQVNYTHQFSETELFYQGKDGFDQNVLNFVNSLERDEPVSFYGKSSCSKCRETFIDVPLSNFDTNHTSNDGNIAVSRYEYVGNQLYYVNDYSVAYAHFDHILKDGECIFCHAKP